MIGFVEQSKLRQMSELFLVQINTSILRKVLQK